MHLVKVGELSKDSLVSEGYIDEAVVGQSAHGGQCSRLLATSLRSCRNEESGMLSPIATGGPDATGLVPEGLPLGREVTVTGGDTEQDGIVGEKVSRLSHGVAGLGGSVHLAKDLFAEGLGNPRKLIVSQWAGSGYGGTYWKISA